MKVKKYIIILCIVVFIMTINSCSSLKDTPPATREEKSVGLKEKEEKSFITAVNYYNAGNIIQAKKILIELRNKSKKYAPIYYYLGLIAYDELQYDIAVDCGKYPGGLREVSRRIAGSIPEDCGKYSGKI